MTSTTSIGLRRLTNEAQQLQSANLNETNWKIHMCNDNIFHWVATIRGPPSTPYEGYEFILDIRLPNNYPFSPIIPRFVTPIKHLNVNSEGNICADILKPDKWESTICITAIIGSIISLLSEPNPADPLNAELAELYRTDELTYDTYIRNHCKTHAKQSL